MGDKSEVVELRRRLAVLEEVVEGERNVSRHMLRKMNDIDDKMTSLAKAVDRLEESVALLRADLPKIIVDAVGAALPD